MKKLLATTAVVGMMATAASAATVVDLRTGGDVTSLGQYGSFSSGTVSGNIDPWRWGPTNDYLTQTSAGLGVTGFLDSNSQLDGLVDEAITFTFDRAVRLVSVTFSYFSGSDDADIYVNGVKVADESNSNPYYFGKPVATSFTVAADGIFDNFRIKSFKVAPVPLPAAGFLLLGGLAGLGALSRKRKKAA
ncbi:VPLPA-CTERM protein sorting domain-containing protein [Aliiroseovarius sediminilitoris]|uniref:VPLPA-CTERM protein sorting domain-containing protein n=1 Tax=Aliiroseovarius sediminilitoris TaxID=1173584 RepID=A0A1I0R9H1_9RHOB|nr:VPLPA-CTERM sorting domain-containing protein [Aliiroseovarius sediminilitoris]SEW37220.1 VPLPA-CTERM protein sorting domain-containing protein [Aliiroseovarius sediminilitoris]